MSYCDSLNTVIMVQYSYPGPVGEHEEHSSADAHSPASFSQARARSCARPRRACAPATSSSIEGRRRPNHAIPCAKLALREIFECAARIRRNESVRHRRRSVWHMSVSVGFCRFLSVSVGFCRFLQIERGFLTHRPAQRTIMLLIIIIHSNNTIIHPNNTLYVPRFLSVSADRERLFDT